MQQRMRRADNREKSKTVDRIAFLVVVVGGGGGGDVGCCCVVVVVVVVTVSVLEAEAKAKADAEKAKKGSLLFGFDFRSNLVDVWIHRQLVKMPKRKRKQAN